MQRRSVWPICETWPLTLTHEKQLARSTHEMRLMGPPQQYMAAGRTHEDGATMGLRERRWPTTIRVALHMSIRPTGHDRTIRWLTCHNVVKVLLTGRWPAQMDHLHHARLVRPRRSAWPRHKPSEMWLMVQTHVEWFTRRTREQWPTQPRHGKQHTAADLNMGHGLQHTHVGTTQARTGDPLRVRRM